MSRSTRGQEPNVARGGRRLFTHLSPLVMAEFKHGTEFNETLPGEFASFGYPPYRLVPGLLLLAPLGADEPMDPYLLNLFFCNEDRAQTLAARDLLVTHLDSTDHVPRDYPDVLDSHASALDATLPAPLRLGFLRGALNRMESLVQEAPALGRRLTLARLRADYGLRDGARREFELISEELCSEDTVVEDDERFLLPMDCFARVGCLGDRKSWVLAAVSAWLATKCGYSSYFVPDEALRHLHAVRKTRYCLEETERLIGLILRRRYGSGCIVDGWAEL